MSGCGSITSRYSDKLLNKSGGKLKKLSKKKPLYWPSEEKYPAESPAGPAPRISKKGFLPVFILF